MTCNKLFTASEYDLLHAAITDLSMTVKRLKSMVDDHDLILREMWEDLRLVRHATVPPKKVSPHIQQEAGTG